MIFWKCGKVSHIVDLCGKWRLITLFPGLFVTLPTAMTWVSLFPRSLAAQPGPASNLSSRARTGCSSPTGAAAEHRISTLSAVEQQMCDHEVENNETITAGGCTPIFIYVNEEISGVLCEISALLILFMQARWSKASMTADCWTRSQSSPSVLCFFSLYLSPLSDVWVTQQNRQSNCAYWP